MASMSSELDEILLGIPNRLEDRYLGESRDVGEAPDWNGVVGADLASVPYMDDLYLSNAKKTLDGPKRHSMRA